jgi:hypothetical protein
MAILGLKTREIRDFPGYALSKDPLMRVQGRPEGPQDPLDPQKPGFSTKIVEKPSAMALAFKK